MCIRDRVIGCVNAFEAVGEVTHACPMHDVTGQAFDLDIVAVSYTHLRAHETVLDLVCRLLLEKKNTPTANRPKVLYTYTNLIDEYTTDLHVTLPQDSNYTTSLCT